MRALRSSTASGRRSAVSYAARRAQSQTLSEIAQVIGEENALALAWAFRGQSLYIPKDPATKPEIAEAIGQQAATSLCSAFWRTYLYMPTTMVTEIKALAMLEDGTKPPAVATALGISERQVYRIKARSSDPGRESSDQPRLL